MQNGDELGEIRFAGADGTNLQSYAASIRTEVDGTPGSGDMPGRLIFSTTADGAGSSTERARITSGGDLLVGTTSNPSSSGVGSAFIAEAEGRRTLFMRTNTTDTRVLCNFGNPNGERGSIQVASGGTSYVTTSDYRLKENVAPMTGALATVSALKPCTYTWKVDGSAGQGFIAHELQTVVPDCVTGEKDAVNEDGSIAPQGIDTSFLVATLTAAIQELKAELDTTKARLAALEAN